MLFHFFTSLVDQYSFLNVFKYLTFRTGLSVMTSLIIVFVIGAPLIKIFSEKMITGPIRQDGPIDHIVKKSGTPTMGGVIIIIGILIMYTTHLIDYKYLKGLSKIILPLIIILLIFTAFQGNEIEGANASRWINIPLIGISFQPSALASIFLLIYIFQV